MDYKIKYKTWVTELNSKLIKNETHFKELEIVYIKMFKIFEQMKLNKNSSNMDLLYKMTIDLENVEYEMQELFGFTKNRDYHRYWHQNGVCTCPYLDNIENYGTPYRLTVSDCILHGVKIKNYIQREEKLKTILKKDE